MSLDWLSPVMSRSGRAGLSHFEGITVLSSGEILRILRLGAGGPTQRRHPGAQVGAKSMAKCLPCC